MARCEFCGEQFANKQAVRAHLKGCAAYPGKSHRQAALPKAMLAMPLGNAVERDDQEPQVEFDPVRQMRGQLTAEKLRLSLRDVHQAHAKAMRRMSEIIGGCVQKAWRRRCVLPRLIGAAALIAWAQVGIAQPMLDYESVSLINLIATPERYHGKKVVVSGWIALNLEDMSLCLGKEVPSGKECVWIEFEDGTRSPEAFDKRLNQWRQHNGKLVVVHGVFNKDNQGHLGGWSGALEKIERVTARQRNPAKSSK